MHRPAGGLWQYQAWILKFKPEERQDTLVPRLADLGIFVQVVQDRSGFNVEPGMPYPVRVINRTHRLDSDRGFEEVADPGFERVA